ncbi:ABC transporter permease [Ascidiimonas sp. W6]|uniref:ABC transporter permease n=1 Tax=Ascidiimonas meishanensis TaxID=3128903 RepID=UPI0030EE89D0
MFNKDRWLEILEVLSSNMFRTIMTAFGVFWGILILIILLAVGKGLENGVKKDFDGIATNTMFMWSQTATKPFKGLPKGRAYNFKLDDVEAIRQNVKGLQYISPRNRLGGPGQNNVIKGTKSGGFDIYGDYPEINQQETMDILEGRFLNYTDLNQRRKVAVIGEGVKLSLFEENESILGTYIKIQGVNFLVIGIYGLKSSNGDLERQQKKIYIPFTTFSQAFNMADKVSWMAITAKDNFSITQLKENIFSIIKDRHQLSPDDDRAVGHFDLYQEFSKIERLFTAIRLIAYVVGILVLLSGVIGVSNIMLIVIKERTKEIGIRRALGESPWSIKVQILLESVSLTIISGMAGIVFATLLLYIMNYILELNGPVDMFANPSVNLGVVFIALSILIGAGLLAGFLPAQNAIKVKPIDALRSE